MKLFSKIKDYNEKLEEILDNKTFSSNIKNILLSMIYKIEISYKDYKEIKRVVRKREDFLNEIISSIKNYCDNIKAVQPDKSEANILKENNLLALTNEKERSILTFPTETACI